MVLPFLVRPLEWMKGPQERAKTRRSSRSERWSKHFKFTAKCAIVDIALLEQIGILWNHWIQVQGQQITLAPESFHAFHRRYRTNVYVIQGSNKFQKGLRAYFLSFGHLLQLLRDMVR